MNDLATVRERQALGCLCDDSQRDVNWQRVAGFQQIL